MKKITLFTITGLKARILKLIVGTPFLLIGGAMVYGGLGDLAARENLLLLGSGVFVGFIGVYSYISAILDDSVAVTLGGSSTSFE